MLVAEHGLCLYAATTADMHAVAIHDALPVVEVIDIKQPQRVNFLVAWAFHRNKKLVLPRGAIAYKVKVNSHCQIAVN